MTSLIPVQGYIIYQNNGLFVQIKMIQHCFLNNFKIKKFQKLHFSVFFSTVSESAVTIWFQIFCIFVSTLKGSGKPLQWIKKILKYLKNGKSCLVFETVNFFPERFRNLFRKGQKPKVGGLDLSRCDLDRDLDLDAQKVSVSTVEKISTVFKS